MNSLTSPAGIRAVVGLLDPSASFTAQDEIEARWGATTGQLFTEPLFSRTTQAATRSALTAIGSRSKNRHASR